MGKCEAKEQCASKTADHPPQDLTDTGTNMIQNAPISDMAVDNSTMKATKTSKDMKSTSVNVKSTTPNVKSTTPSVKPTTPSVKPTSLQENLASNPNSFLAAIGDSEEYVKPIVKDGEIILEVECGQNKAYLYLSKLCQGSKGPCIYFQTSWLTPNEFQFVSGRETAKDWKRSIRHHGKSLKLLLTKGILSVHPTVCDCEGCRHGSSTPTRCRTGEKRKAPSSEGKKVKKPQGAVEHHANGAFKPVSRPGDGAKPSLSVDGKIPQDQNLPSFSGKKSVEKHCSPLKESKSTNVIDAANPQPCERRLSETELPVLKKAKVQGQEEVSNDVKIKVPDYHVPGNEPPLSIPVPVLLPPIGKPKEAVKTNLLPTPCHPTGSVAKPVVKTVTEPVSEVKVEVKVHVKPHPSCPEASLPEPSCSDVNVTETVCVTDNVDVSLKPEPEKAETAVRSDSPVIEAAKGVNISVDVQPASPSSSSCPSSPEPTEDSEICQRTLPVCSKYLKSHSAKQAERTVERATVSQAKEPEQCKESPKVKVHVSPKAADDNKPKATDDSSPKSVKKDAEKVSPRSIPDPRTASEVPQLRQPETGDAAFSDYMRLLAAGHGPQMLHQHPASIETLYNMRPPEVQVNPAMLHPLQACSMYSHPGMVQKEAVSYPTTAGAMPTQIGAPCFTPLQLLPARVPYAMHPPPMVDMTRSLQYLPVPGSVPYHCGTMGLKRGSSELETASALDLSTSKRLRLEYPTPEYRIDSLPGCHGFQPYGYDYSRNFSEELSRKLHAEEGLKPTGSLDFPSYTPSWIDHAGKAVLHRCTCAESRPGDIRFWSVEDVCRFISMLDGCSVYAENFREQRVDGRILPLLTTDHLMKNLGMKLGPALLVAEAVAKKVQEASKYPGCDSCRKLILGVS